MKCHAKNRAGRPCAAPVVRGTKLCVMHSGRAAELGSKGGRRRAVLSPDNLKELPVPETAAELRDMLAQSIVEVRAGKVDPKVANSISYMAASFLRAVEADGLKRGQPANPQGATAYQVYEAAWLREKKARWSAELEEKYASQFPPNVPTRDSA
jgi:hypothetical protein